MAGTFSLPPCGGGSGWGGGRVWHHSAPYCDPHPRRAPFALPTGGRGEERCTARYILVSITCASLFVALAVPSFAAEIAPDDRRSGYADMSRETKAMQDDDTA